MAQPSTYTRVFTCPGCGAQLTADARWPQWCPTCGWGLAPDPLEKLGRVARWRRRRMNAAVLAEHHRLRGADLRPQRRQRLLAGAIAALVHLSALALAALGIWLWWTPPPLLLRFVFSALALALAWEARPRFPRLDSPAQLRRSEAPHTFALLDRVCSSVNAPRFDVVTVTSAFNAGTNTVGLRHRERHLAIGLPLWNVLQREEKLALLGHEVGHLVNGDARNTLLTGSALGTLRRWQFFLTPDRFVRRIGPSRGRVRQRQVAASPSRILGAILLVPPSLVLAAVGAALRRATSAAGQRAEYRADELSVAVAGRAATRRLLELMFDAHGAPFAMQVALRRDPSADIWVAEKDYLADLPETERQRIRRNAERAFHRTDDSHPPTQLRIDLLDSRPEPPALLALDEDLERLVDAELFSCAPVVRTSILDRVRS